MTTDQVDARHLLATSLVTGLDHVGIAVADLDAAITWYRDGTNKIQAVGLPSDAIYEDNTRTLAMEAVRLAFESARAAAPLAERETPRRRRAA